jgi:hypothetical protein
MALVCHDVGTVASFPVSRIFGIVSPVILVKMGVPGVVVLMYEIGKSSGVWCNDGWMAQL